MGENNLRWLFSVYDPSIVGADFIRPKEMKMKILLQRHGESVSNKQNLFTGLMDKELSDIGIAQGKLASEYIINNYKVDKIYSSTLKRAVQTAHFTADKLNIEVIQKKDLVEYYAGDWEGKKLDDIKVLYPAESDIWVKDISKVETPHGQKMSDFYNIKTKAFDEIINENKGFNGTILIVGHVLALMCIICHITKGDIKYLKDIKYFPNASMFDFDYDEKTKTFTNNKWGYCEYLQGMITSTYDDWNDDK